MAVMAKQLAREFRDIQHELSTPELVKKCVSLCSQLGLTPAELAMQWDSFALNRKHSKPTLAALDGLRASVSRKNVKSAASNSTHPNRHRDLVSLRPKIQSFDNTTLGQALNSMKTPSPPSNKKRQSPGAGAARGRISPGAPPSKVRRGMAKSLDRLKASASGLTMAGDDAYRRRSDSGKVLMTFNAHLVPSAASAAPASSRPRCELQLLPSGGGSAAGGADAAAAAKEEEEVKQSGSGGGKQQQQQQRRQHQKRGAATALTKPYRYMHTPLDQKAAYLERRQLTLTRLMQSKFDLGELAPVATPSQSAVRVSGRVACDSEGRLNAKSVVLEGSLALSHGARVPLTVDAVAGGFVLFPGQVVVAEGTSTGLAGSHRLGRRGVQAEQMWQGCPAPLPRTPRATLSHYHQSAAYQGNKALSLVVAAGPFTTSDNLEYRPLNDLLESVLRSGSPPDVVVLVGPFIDGDHPMLRQGIAEMVTDGGEHVELSYSDLFRLQVSMRVEEYASLSPATRFVLLPSVRDLHHHPVFPQPPFSVASLDLPDTPQVLCVPNPCMLRVNEMVIGASSLDILRHVMGDNATRLPPPPSAAAPAAQRHPSASASASASPAARGGGRNPPPRAAAGSGGSGGGRVNRLALLTSAILGQRSFYPLHPPPATYATADAAPTVPGAGGGDSGDSSNAVVVPTAPEAPLFFPALARGHADMSVTPDITIFASQLQHFAHVSPSVGTLCLNPGRLALGTRAGTYARLTVHPIPAAAAAASAGAGGVKSEDPETLTGHDVAARTCVQIVRV